MKRYIAELIGTFALVFFGTGSIIINQETGGLITHIGIACSFGLVVTVMIYALGSISGAHLNPAVTIAFTVAGRFSFKELLPYIFSQCTGALLASTMLHLLFPANELLGATIPAGTALQSFLLEMILGFFLMLVILQVAHGNKEQGMFAGLAIGAVVFLEGLVAGPVSGASMNPARSLAPAIISGHYEHSWLYILAPISGALLSIPVFYLFQPKK